MPPLVAAARLLLAGLCGAIVGYEREKHEKGAGLRTHMLICVGASLFTLVALRVAEQSGGDMLRLIQGMLLGIGFIAGGLIFTQGGSVRGLTTAAGLWVITGVGVAAGLGYYFLAVFGTILAAIILAWLKPVESRIHEQDEPDEDAPPADS